MEFDPDQKAANESDRVLVRAALGGAACGLLWGALIVFLMFRDDGFPALLGAFLILSMLLVPIGGYFGLFAVFGFRFITGR
jgi:hypothetical protein